MHTQLVLPPRKGRMYIKNACECVSFHGFAACSNHKRSH
jgi:hypothetical protein